MNSEPVDRVGSEPGTSGTAGTDAAEPRRPVVVAVDGSAGGGRALEWALAAARLRGARLRIVHVRSYPIPLVDGPFTALLERRGNDPVLDQVRALLVGRADLPELEFVTVDGGPRHELPGLGDDAGLLVLGSRGRGGFVGLLLGSNGLTCAREAACPVVVVRAESDAGSAPGVRPESVAPRAGAVDGPAVAEEPCVVLGLAAPAPDDAAMAFAFAEAARRGARLQVVAAYPWPVLSSTAAGDFVMSAVADSDTEKEYGQLAGGLLAPYRERYPDVPVEVRVASGDAAGHLVDASRSADLVVVGRHRRRPAPGRLLGSVTNAVLLHAGCPVAVVPQPA
ncbi:universal stress protein [Streptomyces sp. NPDC052114]|uniref:universal stress protein n=1 Tax=unclassified Streptomyces TaxID=2593676 RepID=UPI00343AB876